MNFDIRSCVKFYDEDDLHKLKSDYPITAGLLVELASYKIDSFKIRKMNDLLEYVDGNGFFITYDNTIERYIVERGKME